MKRDLGGTLDKRKKELKSTEGKKQKEYMEQRLTTEKVGGERSLRLNLLALYYCTFCTLPIVGICTSLFSSSSTNIFCNFLISS